mgnify:CR=1 FL=1
MATINNRVIGIPENQRNKKALHPNPTFGINFPEYKRYQNNKIFQLKDNTPSINSRIGMSQNQQLVARPCEPISDRMKIRVSSGFRTPHYEVRAGNGLSPRFFTSDRLNFTADLKQKPLINKIY